MCCRTSAFSFSKDINWDGDVVLFDTTVRAMRTLPDVKPRRRYAVDIREFLAMENSSVLHDTLTRIANGIAKEERYRFFIKERGAFDFRALHVVHHVCENVRYARKGSRNYDTWLYPDETLAAGGGDCEDLAFLIAALLTASGISPYMVRVAFGYVRDLRHPHDTRAALHQHAWVMYRSESGAWMLFDPLALRVPKRRARMSVASTTGTKRTKRSTAAAAAHVSDSRQRFEYLPMFVMNADHVWRVEHGRRETLPDFLQRNYRAPDAFWRSFNPSFNAETHYTVFVRALHDTGLFSAAELFMINAASLAIDADVGLYHPYDHFDNGYIDEGWARVEERLGRGTIIDFAHAMHAVADFYAHSSYGHFFLKEPSIPLYTGRDAIRDFSARAEEMYVHAPVRDHADSLNPDHFSSHARAGAHVRPAVATRYWMRQGIISGRYAQPGDAMEGPFSFGAITAYPDELKKASELERRGWLPHHNEIAVDSERMGDAHTLYGPDSYSREYVKRVDAAVRHTMELGRSWKGKR